MGTLSKDVVAMEKYRSLRDAIRIPNSAILKIRLNDQESEMSQLITHHLPLNLVT
jgi:hypothetical protein